MADVANIGRIEIDSSVTDSLRSVHGVVYVIIHGRIRIPRISGNFCACAETVCTRLSFPPTKESLGSRIMHITAEKSTSSDITTQAQTLHLHSVWLDYSTS